MQARPVLEIPLDGELLKALASDTRRDILGRLAQRRMTLSELSQVLNLGKATVSEHLQKLVTVGLVDRHEDPERIWVYHSLSHRGRNLMEPERVRFTFVWALAILGLVIGAMAAAFALMGGLGADDATGKDDRQVAAGGDDKPLRGLSEGDLDAGEAYYLRYEGDGEATLVPVRSLSVSNLATSVDAAPDGGSGAGGPPPPQPTPPTTQAPSAPPTTSPTTAPPTTAPPPTAPSTAPASTAPSPTQSPGSTPAAGGQAPAPPPGPAATTTSAPATQPAATTSAPAPSPTPNGPAGPDDMSADWLVGSGSSDGQFNAVVTTVDGEVGLRFREEDAKAFRFAFDAPQPAGSATPGAGDTTGTGALPVLLIVGVGFAALFVLRLRRLE